MSSRAVLRYSATTLHALLFWDGGAGRELASVNEALTFGLSHTSTCQSVCSSSPQACEPERVNGILKLKWPWCIVAHWQRTDPRPPDCANYFEIGDIMYNCAELGPCARVHLLLSSPLSCTRKKCSCDHLHVPPITTVSCSVIGDSWIYLLM